MLFSGATSQSYQRPQLVEVICQLRFPTILSIDTQEPAAFQEQIRSAFPQYSIQREKLPPKLANPGSPIPVVEPQKTINNYTFVSADGQWQLNLTQDFFSLSTRNYSSWKNFASQLDKPLAAFIATYHPAYFQRIGLRYLNAISRQQLGLGECHWQELIQRPYLGIMAEDDLPLQRVQRCTVDAQFMMDSSCCAKVHAGPGLLNSNRPDVPQDKECKFIFDLDLFMAGNLANSLAPGALETLHGHAVQVFEGAITPRLRDAMLG